MRLNRTQREALVQWLKAKDPVFHAAGIKRSVGWQQALAELGVRFSLGVFLRVVLYCNTTGYVQWRGAPPSLRGVDYEGQKIFEFAV